MNNSFSLLPSTIRGVNLPNLPVSYDSVRYCMGADWVEFTAIGNLNELPENPFLFTHEHTGHGSKYYNDLYNVDTVYHGEVVRFATLNVKPRPSFLDMHLVQVKLDNRFCYTPDLHKVIMDFCREYQLTFKNFTRLDLFIDYQQLNGYGRDVQAFMKDCAARRIVMKGKSMTTHHKRNEVTGITWGSRQSGMSVTMYNKTLEMLSKTWKPWIEGLWKHAGFDMDYDVYRLEFSMKKQKHEIVNEDGETLSLYSDVTMVTRITDLLNFCVSKHLQFAYNEEGQRFSRMKKYYPLNMQASAYTAQTLCIKPKSSNYTKAYIKRLAVDALFYQKAGNVLMSSITYDHLMDVVARHNLHKWFSRKFRWLNLKKSRFTIFDHLNTELLHTKFIHQSSLNFN